MTVERSDLNTTQEHFWSGEFGQLYTKSNTLTQEEWDQFYLEYWGVSKVEMFEKALEGVSRDSKILEVGSNTGMQLAGLKRLGFETLVGVELQRHAVELARRVQEGVDIIQGSGFDLPFKDGWYDITCTNGVLIHIAPKDHGAFMDELYRCSGRYILGHEYYAEEITDLNYRGNEGFMWKADYAQIFMDRFPDLKLVHKSLYPYVKDTESGNKDCVYLLEKQG